MMTRLERASFERLVRPHLAAAFSLARWLLRSDADAEDAVQEASLRAYRAIDRLQGESGKTWFLAIVRNTCFTALDRARPRSATDEFDEERHVSTESDNPEEILLRGAEVAAVGEELEKLAPEFREAIVLREVEGLSYKEIADVAGIPIGTVMSRLSRARKNLIQALSLRDRGTA
jgi:RNA polymerase sigma-70 factor (ECF subfamily)